MLKSAPREDIVRTTQEGTWRVVAPSEAQAEVPGCEAHTCPPSARRAVARGGALGPRLSHLLLALRCPPAQALSLELGAHQELWPWEQSQGGTLLSQVPQMASGPCPAPREMAAGLWTPCHGLWSFFRAGFRSRSSLESETEVVSWRWMLKWRAFPR